MLKAHWLGNHNGFQITCDLCFAWADAQPKRFSQVIGDAQKKGWYIVFTPTRGLKGSSHICPRCAKKPLISLR